MNNTRVFRFLSIALLAAIALYFAAQGYFALTDPFTTTLVYQSSAEDTIEVSGWLAKAAPCAMRSARANGWARARR